MRPVMSDPSLSMPSPSELLTDLMKDGGRRVMYGGDPYEDDVERDTPPVPTGTPSASGRKDSAA
jgi:hypothetical protein